MVYSNQLSPPMGYTPSYSYELGPISAPMVPSVFRSSSPSPSAFSPSSPSSSLSSSPTTPILGPVSNPESLASSSMCSAIINPSMNPSSPTSNTSSKKKQPPRPTNSFMIYRTEKLHELPRDTAAKLSKILGARWKAEPPEVKERYAELAKEAERRHAEQYPNYKFMPAKRGTGKKAQAVRAKTGKSPHSIGHVVPSHPPSFALYPPSFTAKSFTPYPYTNTYGGQVNVSTPYLPRRSDSTPGPMRYNRHTVRPTRSCSSSGMIFRSSYDCAPGQPYNLEESESTTATSTTGSSLYFDPLQSFPWTTPFMSDPTQSQSVEATLGSSIKSQNQNQNQNQGQGLNETTYFSQLLNAELAEAIKMNPPRSFYVQSTEADSMTGLVATSSSMGLPTTPGEDPSSQVLLDTGVSALTITSPSPSSTSSLPSSSSDVQTTAATTGYPILGGSSALANGLSFSTTQASTMTSAPIQIPMASSSMSMSTRHVPTESPYLGSSLTEQDMLISPVQSACSSFSPSMSLSATSLLEHHHQQHHQHHHHHHPSAFKYHGEVTEKELTPYIKSEDSMGSNVLTHLPHGLRQGSFLVSL